MRDRTEVRRKSGAVEKVPVEGVTTKQDINKSLPALAKHLPVKMHL